MDADGDQAMAIDSPPLIDGSAPAPAQHPAPVSSNVVMERLRRLQALDEDIVSLLSAAADALASLNNETSDAARDEFKAAVERYFNVLETVSVELRKEAKALQDSNILTVAVNTKVKWVGKQKESETLAWAERVLAQLRADGLGPVDPVDES
ncbi:uncharacterized protein V1510DRAFT_401940 [Dipodascopsis tothii]|uniref:uncharacterized protein n=1 Tax=Dipodascopsis tothii TaxID=44089 RepID=UPI0034CD987D